MGIKDAVIELIEERAAIMEYDGDIPREEAEVAAVKDIEEFLGFVLEFIGKTVGIELQRVTQ